MATRIFIETRFSFFQGRRSSINAIIDHFDFPVTVLHSSFLHRIAKRLFLLSSTPGSLIFRLAHRLNELQIKDKLVVRLTRSPKIVHFVAGYFLELFSLNIPKTKTVVTLHQPESEMKAVLASARSRLRRRTEKFVSSLKYAEAVVVLGTAAVPYYSQYVDVRKLRVILHGVDTEFFHPGVPVHAQHEVLTVGNWLRDFDLWLTVVTRVLQQYSRACFTVITMKQRIEVLKRKVAEHLPEFSERIRLLSNLTDRELLIRYQQSSILFLPLKDALANNALLEGMSCGLPIVVSDIAAVREYIGDSRCAQLISNSDPHECAGEIIRLLENDTQQAEMGRRARIRAEQLDWKKIAKEYESLYKEVAGN